MSRPDHPTVRAVGIAVLGGAAVVLSGCVSTVDGRAVAGATLAPISIVTTAPPGSSAVEALPVPTAPEPTTDQEEARDNGYTDLAIGDSVIVWDDDGEGEIILRGAHFEDTAAGRRFSVTVDYECYDGECPYGVAGWTVTGADGARHLPEASSGFGPAGDVFGVMATFTEKRGHLAFVLPDGPVTVELDAASGDPATWTVPAV